MTSCSSSDSESIFDAPCTPSKFNSRTNMNGEVAKDECSHSIQLGPRISTLSSNCTVNDLDFEVFRIDDPTFPTFNEVDLSASDSKFARPIYPKQIIQRVETETTVYVATGTTGCISGTILESPYFVKMTGSKTYQETWQVLLERPTGKQLHSLVL